MVKSKGVKLADIGSRFREARESIPLTQTELARMVGATQPQISRFEKGQRGLKSDTMLQMFVVAAQHGISIDYVLLGARRGKGQKVFVGAGPNLLSKLQDFIDAHSIDTAEETSSELGDEERASKGRHKDRTRLRSTVD